MEYLISQALCYAKFTRKIIHLFNLTNTLYDLFRHINMSPDFHMKKIDNSSSVSPNGGDHKIVQLSLD